ncbi:hypothetical protein Scep_022429 [Stephania cephalantha]|uniref:Uncharacterized protein n=1 Tax=Stephania cephalantha TaxID=152367 RepID=A0AAP0I289_9MAGN
MVGSSITLEYTETESHDDQHEGSVDRILVIREVVHIEPRACEDREYVARRVEGRASVTTLDEPIISLMGRMRRHIGPYVV